MRIAFLVILTAIFLIVLGNQTSGPELLVNPEAKVSGHAVNAPFRMISITQKDVDIIKFFKSTTTDSKGYFEFNYIPPGGYTISLYSEGIERISEITIPEVSSPFFVYENKASVITFKYSPKITQPTGGVSMPKPEWRVEIEYIEE